MFTKRRDVRKEVFGPKRERRAKTRVQSSLFTVCSRLYPHPRPYLLSFLLKTYSQRKAGYELYGSLSLLATQSLLWSFPTLQVVAHPVSHVTQIGGLTDLCPLLCHQKKKPFPSTITYSNHCSLKSFDALSLDARNLIIVQWILRLLILYL